MASRAKDPRLQELFDSGKKVYSISKCNTIDECLFEAYNSYILHNKGVNGIYGVLGTKIHDKLEDIIEERSTAAELPDVLNEELQELEMLGLEFPKDFKGNDTIRNNWVADMKHFCLTFVPPKGEFLTEQLFIYKISEDRYVQGYIDLTKLNKDSEGNVNSISIYDWKTSTDFKPADLLHHGRQLAIYAVALEAEGYTVKEVAWIMLKYCEVSFIGKKRSNSKEKSAITKVLNRGKLLQELKSYIETDLEELGYDEITIECLIDSALKSNSFDELPEEIKKKYVVKPYVRKYELTDEIKQEAIDYINAQADKFESLNPDNIKEWPPREFTRINGKGNQTEDTFFCNSLCNFRNTCVHIKRFNDTKQLEKENKDSDSDLF